MRSIKKDEKKKSDGHAKATTEVDYDVEVTQLYNYIENKQWEKAIARIDSHRHEARIWIFRRNPEDPKKIKWRLLPLHACCIFRSPLSVIEGLVSAYPDAAQMKDDQNMLPIHLACRNGASKGVVLTLLYVFPESVSVKDRKGRTPTDLVEASESQNRDAVLSALKTFTQNRDDGGTDTVDILDPIQPNEVDYDNRTVLFRMILKKDWDAASARCESHPEEVSTWIVAKGFQGNLRFLPLHKACVLQPTIGIIEALISAFPDSVNCKDQDGWLPLHCACFYGSSHKVINTLLEANPDSSRCKDSEGRMPLHYATLKCAEENVVSILLRANPNAAIRKDDEGKLPIHYACSKGAPNGSIEALLKVSSKGAQSKDDQGRLPIHHLCRKHGTQFAIESLLKLYPKGIKVQDDLDKLPIHYACQMGADTAVLNMLLEAYPESVEMKNAFDYTPLDEAVAMGHKMTSETITNFIENRNKTEDPNGEMILRSKVKNLSSRVKYLESLLSDVVQIGASLKKHSGTDANFLRLAEKLSSLDLSEKNKSER